MRGWCVGICFEDMDACIKGEVLAIAVPAAPLASTPCTPNAYRCGARRNAAAGSRGHRVRSAGRRG